MGDERDGHAPVRGGRGAAGGDEPGELFEKREHRGVENLVGAGSAETRKTRRIVVCGDDFGMNPAVDGGILLLAGMGRMSAVSCLSLGPSFAANTRVLRQPTRRTWPAPGPDRRLWRPAGHACLLLLIASAYAGGCAPRGSTSD